MTQIVALDPGMHGGLIVLNSVTGAVELSVVMPLNDDGKICGYSLSKLIRNAVFGNKDVIGVVELVNSMPGQGSVSGFSFGFGTGKIHGVLETLGISPIIKPRPQAWKKAVLGDLYDHKEKAGTIAWCIATYPSVSLVPPRCRVAHDGLADGLGLAHYGLMYLNGTLPQPKKAKKAKNDFNSGVKLA